MNYSIDLCLHYSLLPTDVMKRAKSRFLINFFDGKVNSAFFKFVRNYSEEGSDTVYKTEMTAHLLRVSWTRGGEKKSEDQITKMKFVYIA
jgi:hypothetical protein